MAKHFYVDIPYNYYPFYEMNRVKRKFYFKIYVLLWLLKDSGLGNIQLNKLFGYLHIFCGKQKLNKVINEACLLGLEDALFISNERRI